MEIFFTKLTAVFMSLITWVSVIFFPLEVEGIFSKPDEGIIQTEFDEGDFTMGEHDIIVAPNGNDSNPGTLESPLKTPEAAKEKAKQLKGIATKTVTVWFREGTYTLANPLEFTAEDLDNVVYRSYPYETVEFSGAKEISGNWRTTTINGANAFVTDISIDSDSDYFRSLFKGNRRLPRSNYPKEGLLKVANPKTDEASVPENEAQFFTKSVVFYASPDDMKAFSNVKDVDVRIMHFWCDELLPVYSVDPSTGRIETRKPTAMTVRVEDNFVFENVREALTLPGEWYLDRSESKLYYIPEDGDTPENTVLYASTAKKLITVNNAKNITFSGIDFVRTDWEYTGKNSSHPFSESHPLYKNIEYGVTHPQAAYETPAAINISFSDNIDFINCCFENISYTAMKIKNDSKNCDITSCLFNEIGGNAIFIHNEDNVPNPPKNINVTDCHINKYGRIFNNAIGILLTYASDCNLTNNEIHDGWYTGISVGWVWGYDPNPTNNIKICDNLIYDIGNGWLSDMGAIYTLGIQPDTVISGNVIYNVGCDEGRYGYGGWGIYLDEGSSGMLVENNLVYDCSSQTFHQHYGKDNIIKNNIFAFGGEGAFRITRNEEHNSLTLSNNILVTDNATMYALTTDPDWFIDNSNLYYDYKNGGNVYSGDSMNFSERKSLVIMTMLGYYNNAVFADPLFKDAQNRDFTLADNSPALEAGFKPFSYNAGTLTKFN